MPPCPVCKEQLPLLSKICPLCGYVVENDDNAPSAEDFANTLEKCLYEMKEIPQPSFGRSMAQLSFIMFPLLAIYMLIIAFISSAGLFWILSALFAILSISALVKKMRGKLGNEPFDRAFKKIKNEFEYNERTAKRHFGKSKEVTRLIDQINIEISGLEAARSKNNRKNLFIWLVIMVIFFSLGGASLFSIDKSLNSISKAAGNDLGVMISEGKWEEAIQNFNASPEKNDEYESNKIAVTVLPVILSAGEFEKAEEFFLKNCMGKPEDLKCAQLIVTAYKDKGNQEAAESFIEKCSGMRYKSDQKKLKKSLNN